MNSLIRPNRLFALMSLAVIIAMLLTSCNQKEAREYSYNTAFNRYITSYTSGEVSRNTTIQVRMKDQMVDYGLVGTDFEENPFDFRPRVKGRAYWSDTRTVAFEPETPFDSDTYYKVKLDLETYVEEVEDGLEEFEFQFSTLKQGLFLSVEGLEPMEEEKMDFYQLKGKLSTVDYEGWESIEGLLAVKMEGNLMPIKWGHENVLEHQFFVDSIPRAVDRGLITVEWNGKDIGLKNDHGKREVIVPALGDFKLESHEVTNSPNQFVSLRFSDPLKKKQDLTGLVTIEEHEVKYVIRGTELRVYPKNRVRGWARIKINPGIQNLLGHKLQDSEIKNVEFTELKPEIRLLGNGNIIPKGSSLPFVFEAVGLSAVNVSIRRIYEDNVLQFLQVNDIGGDNELHRVGVTVHTEEVPLTTDKRMDLRQWNRHAIDLSKLINPEPGAIYEVSLSMEQDNSLYTCTVLDEEDEEEYEDYWERRENPCRSEYYSYADEKRRNILASDLGIIAKRGSGDQLFIAVNNLRTAQPLPGVSLEFYDYQQQVIKRATTDDAGMAIIETSEFPYMMIAKKGRQRGYMRLGGGYSLSLSKFDVSGRDSDDGVKGFLYGERGVWRPGDSIYVSFIIEDKQNALPNDHPVTFELENPRGQQIQKVVKNKNLNGFYTFRTATAADAPTGNYRLSVNVGSSWFYKTLKVETVIPNRLKIELDMPVDYLSRSEVEDKGSLAVHWLHGAVAQGLKADLSGVLRPSNTSFKGFKGYSFQDPTREFSSEWVNMASIETDEDGNAQFPLSLDAGEDAPGMLKANISVKVFEPGGNFSKDQFSIPFHPYDQYVGVKAPKSSSSWSQTLACDKNQSFSIALVDKDGNALDSSTVEVTLYKLTWEWWWGRSARQISTYNGQFYTREVETKKVKIKNGKGTYRTKVSHDDYGRFMVRVHDPNGGHSAGEIVFFDWDEYSGAAHSENPEGATMLAFTSDKKKYDVGDKVTLSIPAGQSGKALISLENGSKVLKTYWMEVSKGLNKFTFPVTSGMAPNIFAHITLIQPHGQLSNDLPMRLYGLVPIEVEDPATHLTPVIRMPDVLRPEQNVSLKISEATGKPMTYTIAVVDEGLLDLTRYKTPEAWKYFYAKEALGVQTWDLYDQVLGNQSDGIKLLSIGGDGEGAAGEGGTKLNRFKPVVKFLGPFHLPAGGAKTHSFHMPQYVGSVKTMVVAGYDGAYGKAEKATPVRKPLMALGTLPRVLGPEEELKFPVNIFAMEEHVKDVDISLEYSDIFVLDGSTKQSIHFAKTGDQLVEFPLKVKDEIGVGNLKITAVSGKEKAVFDIDVMVRTPNTRVTDFVAAKIEPGGVWSPNFQWKGMEGTNTAVLEVSAMPPLNLGKRMEYLIQYPHGCVEQTTSSVFPQIYLTSLMEMPAAKKKRINKNIKAGIRRLTRFQTPDGGLAYWPGGRESNAWGTNYAGAFLIEAKKKGYKMPYGFIEGWVKYQSKEANAWTTGTRSSQLIQADRLYLLALAGKPELGAMNRMKEVKELDNVCQWRLAAAYHLAGQPEIATQLAKGLSTTVEPYQELYYTYGSDVRDQALILECMSVMGERNRAEPLMESISGDLNDQSWMSTQTTAYALVGMAKYAGKGGNFKGFQYAYTQGSGDAIGIKTAAPISQEDLSTDAKGGSYIKVSNDSEGPLYARVVLSGIPAKDDGKKIKNDLFMLVTYRDMDGNKINPKRIAQGTDFMVDVTMNNTGGKGDYYEMALTQIFPSGWEIINSRTDGVDFRQTTDTPEYQDIRDDRVYNYYDLKAYESKTYRTLLNASYAGKFYLPAVYSEAMYDHTIAAKEPGMWIEVYQQDDKNAIGMSPVGADAECINMK